MTRNAVCVVGTEAISLTIAAKDTRIKALREALEEIRDVARISDGVEWYAMIASKALNRDNRNQ